MTKAERQMIAIASAAGYQDERISAKMASASVTAAPAEPEKTDEKGDENNEEISEQDADDNSAAGMFSLFG